MIISVILAGGIGKRLSPLSTPELPKQFIKFIDNKSMFQHSVENALEISDGPIVIIASSKHHEIIESQLSIYRSHNIHIIFENESYNTALAINTACFYIKKQFGDSYILILPSDHHIQDITPLKRELYQLHYSLIKHINIFGIMPKEVNNSYGYVKKGHRSFYKSNLYKVDNFVEKPPIHIAQKLCESNQYLWNIGIIFASNLVFLKEIKKYNITLSKYSQDLINHAIIIGKNKLILPNLFIKNKISSSIDYLLFEKTRNICISYLNLDWKDLGSWPTLINFFREKYFHQINKISIRPWGHFKIVAESYELKIKILNINSLHRISLQSHKYRDEIWFVLQGNAKVTLGNSTQVVKSKSIIYVSKNVKHRLENVGGENLIILEIQRGNILDENDIERFDDDYKREFSNTTA